MKRSPFTAASKTSFGLPITIIRGDNNIIPASGLKVDPLPIRHYPKRPPPTRAWTPCYTHLTLKSQNLALAQWRPGLGPAYAMALFEKWLFHEHVAWIVALGAEIIILNCIMVYRNRSFTNGFPVQYEDKLLPVVQTLDLNA